MQKMPRKPIEPISQGEAARRLGVTREHLNRVLNGHRESRSLIARYRELLSRVKAEQKGAAA